MGITPDDFYDLEPREAFLLIEAYQEKEDEKWQHTRYVATVLINIHKDPKKKAIKPHELMPLNIDKKGREDMSSFVERAANIFKNEEGN